MQTVERCKVTSMRYWPLVLPKAAKSPKRSSEAGTESPAGCQLVPNSGTVTLLGARGNSDAAPWAPPFFSQSLTPAPALPGNGVIASLFPPRVCLAAMGLRSDARTAGR